MAFQHYGDNGALCLTSGTKVNCLLQMSYYVKLAFGYCEKLTSVHNLKLLNEQFFAFSQIPFEVSLLSIFNLERLFDLANGCIVSHGSLFSWIVSIIP